VLGRLRLHRLKFWIRFGENVRFLCLRFDALSVCVVCVGSLWTTSPEITFSQNFVLHRTNNYHLVLMHLHCFGS
jgi:hypothetical protein